MATMRPTYLDPEPSKRIIRNGGYINKILVSICAAEGLNKFGVKAELQQRIISRIEAHAASNDAVRFNRLKQWIEKPQSIHQQNNYGGTHGSLGATAANGYLSATSNHGSINMGGGTNVYRGPASPRLEFKPSPFYSIEQQVGATKVCEIMQQHRHTVSISLKVSEHPVLARVAREPSLKVMVFCASDGHGRQDVAFPHQSELKANGGDIKANLRGLKNKPGSTRPVDITKELRLNLADYGNQVEMTYALTTKKFYFSVFIVKSVPVTELVKRLETGKRITEKSILDEMASKARDPDIVTTASVLSLKCPLSTLRIDLPIRSISCRHNQCFDGTSYLQLQEQGPTWLCPVCNNPAPFENLAVDEYVKDILGKTSRSTDQVTVQPDGRWDMNTLATSMIKSNGYSDNSDDDDLVEITRSGDSVRTSTPQVLKTPASILGGQSREQSTTSSVPPSGSISAKRPIAEVIDLTSSGDEDEPPFVRPVKRQMSSINGYATPPSVPTFRPPPPPGYETR